LFNAILQLYIIVRSSNILRDDKRYLLCIKPTFLQC